MGSQQQQQTYHYPTYGHGHGYPAVNYQHYAAYPPRASVGGRIHYHLSSQPQEATIHPHQHQYSPPVAHNYSPTATANSPQKQEEYQYQHSPKPIKEGDAAVAYETKQPSQKQIKPAITEAEAPKLNRQQLLTEKPSPKEQVVDPDRI